MRVLNAAIDAGARAVDLEIESAEMPRVPLEELRRVPLVDLVSQLGKHSCSRTRGTPALESFRGYIQAGDDSEEAIRHRACAQCFEAGACGKNGCCLRWARRGLPARVLAPSAGFAWTYATPCTNQGTASGQVSARTLRHLYRVEKITRAAKIFGVIADPVRHSISPAVHNRGFQSKRLDAVYLPFLVAPAHLRDFMTTCDKLSVCGFSVTIPHKQRIIRYLDTIDPLARRIGAVNTVWKKAGKWRGTNTDVFGVTGPLSQKIKLAKAKVLVAGTGGAARGGCVRADRCRRQCHHHGPEHRESEGACEGDRRRGDRCRRGCIELLRCDGACDSARDASARGRVLLRQRDTCGHRLRHGVQPCAHPPVEEGRGTRAEIIPGLEMFMEQAARQFEIFTGEPAPRAAMEKAAVEALGLSS